MQNNVIPFPKTRAQAVKIGQLIRRDRRVRVAIQIRFDDDPFRVQRAWRVLFGLFQDCASIKASKGFKKRKNRVFVGKMRASRLRDFLSEAMAYVAEGRARIYIDGEKLRPRLLEMMRA